MPQGVKHTDSDVATAVRAIVVLAFAWLMAAITGQVGTLGPIGVMSWAFLVLSDVTTGGELDLLLLRLQQGIVSVVVPIDKLSMLVSMRFAAVVLRERYTKRSLVGLALVTIATFAMAVWT